MLSKLFSFFPFVTEKDEKTCFTAEKNDFDQQTVCGAPLRWSKYTTSVPVKLKILFHKGWVFHKIQMF